MPRVRPFTSNFSAFLSFSIILVFCLTANPQEVQGTQIISSSVTLGSSWGFSNYSSFYSYSFENTEEELHLKISMESNRTIDGDIQYHSNIDVYVSDSVTEEVIWEKTGVSLLINTIVRLPEPKEWTVTFDNGLRGFDKYVTFELEIVEEVPLPGIDLFRIILMIVLLAMILGIILIGFFLYRSQMEPEAPKDITAS
ncbi:MAG: hypothetical protein ACFFDT_34770, partial [Candidatus Hodarchaeota archaeon]